MPHSPPLTRVLATTPHTGSAECTEHVHVLCAQQSHEEPENGSLDHFTDERNKFLHSSGGWKANIKVSAGLASSSWQVHTQPSSHCVLTYIQWYLSLRTSPLTNTSVYKRHKFYGSMVSLDSKIHAKLLFEGLILKV